MNSQFFLSQLAKEHHSELLREARINQQLKDAGVMKPGSFPKKLVIALGVLLPFVLLLVRAVAAAGAGGGGGFVHVMM